MTAIPDVASSVEAIQSQVTAVEAIIPAVGTKFLPVAVSSIESKLVPVAPELASIGSQLSGVVTDWMSLSR